MRLLSATIKFALGMGVLILGLWVVAGAAVAQDGGWVDQLQNQSRQVCCTNGDGRRLDDPEWRIKDGHYEVLFTEGWVSVPDHAIVTMRNRDGIARVWSTPMPDGAPRIIRCFLGGSFS